MRWGLPALGVLAGTALQLRQADLWAMPVVVACLIAALLLSALAWRARATWPGLLLLMACAAVFGFASTSLRAAWRLADGLEPALIGQDLVVSGVVASLPRVSVAGTRFVFEVERAELRGALVRLPARLSLGWYRGADDDALLAAPAEDLRAGQRWRFTVRLRPPHGVLNPHGFDLELWLFEQGIGASGYVRSALGAAAAQAGERVAHKLDDAAAHPVQRLRQHLRDAIALRVSDAATARVLAALVVGDQAGIERDDWELFRTTGVAHLMSISGLHVTMFAWLAGALIARLWRLHPRLPLRVPAPQAALWGGLVAAAGYSLLAGWGVPAQRTVWMIAVVVLLRSLGLRWPLAAVLLAAAVGVTLLDPWALLQPGFWLSFVAVGLLAASEPVQRGWSRPPEQRWRERAWHAVRGGVRTQLVASAGLAPLSLLFFQQVSLIGLLANLLAIPLVTLLITPLALLGALLPPLWLVAGALVQGLVAALQWMAGSPLAVWSAGVAPPWAVASGLLAGALAVLPLPWRMRLLSVPLLLPLLAPVQARPAAGRFELVVADVGQGTAVLVRTREHLLVYDAGPQYSAESDAGARVLLPLLRARGEARVDLLMLSHRDTDHVGGAAALLAGVPVRAMSSSLDAVHPLRVRSEASVPHEPCTAGRSWAWDGVRFDVLHPLAGDLGLPVKPNALSCVLRVQGAGGSALLAGDIEAAQEAALVQRSADALVQRSASVLKSDVLLVPHHGSRTSSSGTFLDAVRPSVAVVQAGYRSRFGHPAPDVVARYAAQGIALVRTDRCGAWTMPATGAPWCMRERQRRYWQHAAVDETAAH